MSINHLHKKSSGIERALVIIASVMFLLVLGFAVTSLPGVLSFRWSYYALIPILGIVSNLVLLFIINAHRARIDYILWFGLLLGALLCWGVSELFLELSATAEAAVFWRPLTAIASAFVMPLMLMFVVGQTRPKLLEHKVFPWFGLFAAASGLLYLFFGTNLMVDHNPAHILHGPYGLEMPFSETGGLLYLFWLVSLAIVLVILLVKHFRRQTDELQRRRSALFLTGVIIFWVGTIVTDILLPLVIQVVLPPLGLLLATVMAVLFSYGLLRYRLFTIDPATVAPNILQTMAEAVVVTDTDFHVLFSNTQASKLLAAGGQTVSGRALSEAFAPEAWTTISEAVKRGVQAREVVSLSDVAVMNGSQVVASVDISLSQVTDDNGELAGIVWVLNDISPLKYANKQLAKEKASVERKVVERTRELAETQARLAASLSGLPFGFAIVTSDDQIVFHNAALTTLLKQPISTDPAESEKTLKQMAADYRSSIDILDCLHKAQSTAKVIEQDIAFGPMFYHFLFVPIIDRSEHPTPVGAVMIMEDTTEKKAMDRSRDEFFSIASHELRTPLTAIRGNADMILNYYPEQLKDPSLKEMVSDMHNSSVRLITVVNDFLDMSRLEQGKIEFKKAAFDVPELIQETLREFDATGSRHKLSLELAKPPADLPPVFADRDRTRQILINLLGNAIKFTEKGGATITLTPGRRSIKIAVTDTGKGIPVAMQHLLFRKFQQAADSILTRDDTRGTGLGLYISRLLAESMDGKLEMTHSEVGKGTTFTLELPVIRQDQTPSKRPTKK